MDKALVKEKIVHTGYKDDSISKQNVHSQLDGNTVYEKKKQ